MTQFHISPSYILQLWEETLQGLTIMTKFDTKFDNNCKFPFMPATYSNVTSYNSSGLKSFQCFQNGIYRV
jgi:hypothetical protein